MKPLRSVFVIVGSLCCLQLNDASGQTKLVLKKDESRDGKPVIQISAKGIIDGRCLSTLTRNPDVIEVDLNFCELASPGVLAHLKGLKQLEKLS